jgi:hypothetical protein
MTDDELRERILRLDNIDRVIIKKDGVVRVRHREPHQKRGQWGVLRGGRDHLDRVYTAERQAIIDFEALVENYNARISKEKTALPGKE